DFPGLVQTEREVFQTLLDGSLDIKEVEWRMWRSEMAVVDLLSFIRSSNLESKEVLEAKFERLVTQIHCSGEALRALGSTITAAVDRVMNVNAYVLGLLDSLTPQWFEVLFPSFNAHLANRLHEDFRWTPAASSLEAMESTLASILDIISRESITASNQRDELRGAFWTQLGGNRARLRDIEDRLSVLGGVSNYRTRALKHVHSTSEGVLQMQQDV
ncbi:hypothetical protein BDY19DRAFT_866896, partial [Irpex rosettiformis]